MAANGISTLSSKSSRQIAKLELARTQRQAGGNVSATAYRVNNYYDLSLLPTNYSGNVVVDVAGELILGRPWTSTPPSIEFTNPTATTGSGVSVVSVSPFAGGGNSYQFDGTANSYITYAGSSDWAVGTGDFTIEWFSRQSSLTIPQYQRIFTVGDFPTIKIGVSIESGTFYYWANNTFRYSSASASTANVWIHWAVVRASGITRVYRNGTLLGSQVSDNNNVADTTTSLVIGNTNTYANNSALIGNLTNLRWVKGLAVYTGNFTVPTSALTAQSIANPYGGSNTQAIGEGFTKLLLVP